MYSTFKEYFLAWIFLMELGNTVEATGRVTELQSPGPGRWPRSLGKCFSFSLSNKRIAVPVGFLRSLEFHPL